MAGKGFFAPALLQPSGLSCLAVAAQDQLSSMQEHLLAVGVASDVLEDDGDGGGLRGSLGVCRADDDLCQM